jgi:hypothetical protein
LSQEISEKEWDNGVDNILIPTKNVFHHQGRISITHDKPASNTKTENLGFSVKRFATTFPAAWANQQRLQ